MRGLVRVLIIFVCLTSTAFAKDVPVGPGIWAGGDCATGGDDHTVTVVAKGRDAAEDTDALFH